MRLLALALLLTLCGCGGGGASEPNIPAPVQLRTDLKFCYYGALEDPKAQLNETGDHINCLWASRWWGEWHQIDQMTYATTKNVPVIFDFPEPYQVSYNIPIKGPLDLVASEQRVRTRLANLNNLGILQNVIAVFPQDEPELVGLTDTEITATNQMIRKVFAEYGMSPKIAVIYSGKGIWPGIGSYDWVGFDDYDNGATIFTNGQYDAIRAALRPDQRIVLVPGGCDRWRQDPTQFFNKAEQDAQVIGIIPFVWRDNADPANGATKGIRSNGMDVAYRAVGLKIKQGQ